MCLIVFAWDVHPKHKLILTANRDEFYARPTATAKFWDDQPQILGGRDLEAGGTWMAVSKRGKFAAVTNYRDLSNIKEDAKSRGEIAVNFLTNNLSPREFLKTLHEKAGDYNGFNLLLADEQEMLHYSNYERKINSIKPGVYGLSNALLNTPWPKVERAKEKFRDTVDQAFTHGELIAIMNDTALADEQVLPDTGITKELEKSLSAICIRMKNYGTCCSTVVTMDRMGLFSFTEKSYPVGNRKDQIVNFNVEFEK